MACHQALDAAISRSNCAVGMGALRLGYTISKGGRLYYLVTGQQRSLQPVELL